MTDKLPLLLNGLFGVLIAASLVVLLADRPGSLAMPAQGETPATASGVTGMPPRAAIRAIAGHHLFGRAEQNRPEVRTSPTVAPETRLKLTLSGVIAAADPQQAARAIIAGPDGQDKSYTIDDRLPGGAVVKEIYPDRVILTRSGKYETLRLLRTRLKPNNQNN
jgi:general secretion pathway protein C